MKSLKAMLKQDKEKYTVPKSVHDYIPITAIWEDGIFKVGNKFAKTFRFTDINYLVAGKEDTELNRNMMFSIDIVPIPMDEAVREVENRLLGVETNITNWQRKQNQNNNFSAVVPYDMELQRKESKEFLNDLTTRDQRMMCATVTMAHMADSKEQLDADTETILSTARRHLCQLAVLKFQQTDGLNTVLPIGCKKIQATRTLTTESLAVQSERIQFVLYR